MFSSIKTKIILFLSGLLAIGAAVIKFLLFRNKTKQKEIDILESNKETSDHIHSEDLKRMGFKSRQEAKAEELNSQIKELNKLNKERGKVDEKDNHTSITL